MWSISSLPPQFSMLEGNRFIVILTLLLGAAYFGLSGVISFKKVGTTVHPMQPEKASALVTSGVYQVSRNPMYLGLLLGLISWGLYLSSLWAVACCVLFVAYMNRFQIAPEERAMEKRFGEDFNMYRQRTRRWL
jgi:protein-S-isoprenylcysteine O-methyltransferase Ste14